MKLSLRSTLVVPLLALGCSNIPVRTKNVLSMAKDSQPTCPTAKVPAIAAVVGQPLHVRVTVSAAEQTCRCQYLTRSWVGAEECESDYDLGAWNQDVCRPTGVVAPADLEDVGVLQVNGCALTATTVAGEKGVVDVAVTCDAATEIDIRLRVTTADDVDEGVYPVVFTPTGACPLPARVGIDARADA